MSAGQSAFAVSAEVREAWEHEAAARESLWLLAVDTLTQAARLDPHVGRWLGGAG